MPRYKKNQRKSRKAQGKALSIFNKKKRDNS